MDKKPKLTAKVRRGFAWIRMTGVATLESVMSDEIPSLSKAEADDIETALRWMAANTEAKKRRAANEGPSDAAAPPEEK